VAQACAKQLLLQFCNKIAFDYSPCILLLKKRDKMITFSHFPIYFEKYQLGTLHFLSGCRISDVYATYHDHTQVRKKMIMAVFLHHQKGKRRIHCPFIHSMKILAVLASRANTMVYILLLHS